MEAVALDEAHEMCVNKDLKSAVIRPTQAYLQKTTLFFNYRIVAYKNLIKQLFPERASNSPSTESITDSTKDALHWEENIRQVCSLVHSNHLLPPKLEYNRGLVNVFTGQKATPEQTKDMLTFHQIGDQSFQHYVKHRILQHYGDESF